MEANQIHEQRLQINKIINTLDGVVTVRKERLVDFSPRRLDENHKYIDKAIDKLRYATYWLGKILHYQSTEKADKDYSKGIDDSTDEKLESDKSLLPFLRAEIQKVIDVVDTFNATKDDKNGKNINRAITCTFNYLTESRFAIGELMGELRTQKEAEKKAAEVENKADGEEQVETVKSEENGK